MKRLVALPVLLILLGALLAVPEAHAMETNAKQAFVVDATTGAVLLQKNPDERMPTSSMSKTITMYATFEALKAGSLRLNQPINISERAWKMGGSRMFVNVNTQVSLDDLIKGVIVQSGNDATVAVAEAISGTEENFAQHITKRAHDLGMLNTNLANASGWPDPNHYSTARDLALLGYRLIQDFPEQYKAYYAMPEFTYNNIKQGNRNPLLGAVDGADGIKTGHSDSGGYGLMGSGTRNGRRVILVVNGLKSMAERASESRRLLEWGLGNFRLAAPFKAGVPVVNAPVVFGSVKQVGLAPGRDTLVTAPLSGLQGASVKAKFKSPLKAPLKTGQQVGMLLIDVPQVGQFEAPLVVASDVEGKSNLALTLDKILQAARSR